MVYLVQVFSQEGILMADLTDVLKDAIDAVDKLNTALPNADLRMVVVTKEGVEPTPEMRALFGENHIGCISSEQASSLSLHKRRPRTGAPPIKPLETTARKDVSPETRTG